MFIIDDILLFPARGILQVFREVHNAVQQENATEADTITIELCDLYMMLETGKITETEFDACEKELLDRLDEIREQGTCLVYEKEGDGEEESQLTMDRNKKRG